LVVLNAGSLKTMTVGFPTPLLYKKSLTLSVTVNEPNVAQSWYGPTSATAAVRSRFWRTNSPSKYAQDVNYCELQFPCENKPTCLHVDWRMTLRVANYRP
jgi:hypothetical protein